MTFTIHDVQPLFTAERTKKIIQMLYNNKHKLTTKRKIVYSPIVTRHGTAAEMRQEVIVYDLDNVIALYEYKISPAYENKYLLQKKYERLLKELYVIRENLDD